MSSSKPPLPAIFGGDPVRPQGPPDWPFADPDVQAAMQAAFAGGSWGKYHGPNVSELTQMLAEYHDREFAIPCASGTAAVELALRGLKVGPGDEVILAAYDFKGNFQNVLTVGATPVLIDIHPDNCNFAPLHLGAAITPATKAIVVSHLHGGVVAMPEVLHIAQASNLPVVEDACQMPGAKIHGRVAGTWGDVGILSFGGSKLLTAGRGGALITARADIAQRIKLYTHRGNEAYPLSELQAALLIPQLAKLDEANARRADNVEYLCAALQKIAGLKPFHNAPSDSLPGYFKLGFQYDAAQFGGMSRDAFTEAMHAEGIAFGAGFRALHKVHASRRYRKIDELSQATRADQTVVTLHHPILSAAQDDMLQIVRAVEKIQQYAQDKMCQYRPDE